MTFKKTIGWLHLWLGMISGIIIVIVSSTGSMYVFIDEIQAFLESERNIEIQQKPMLSPLQVGALVHAKYPDLKVNALSYRADQALTVYSSGKKQEGEFLINPYSGKFIKMDISKEGQEKFDFFNFILKGHRFLWFPYKIGRPIVNYATLTFVFILISGLILWWPKNKSAAKQRWWFRWKETTQWRRKNYDLHNIMGFYAMIFLLCIALSGMVYGLQWFSKGLYWTTTGGKNLPEYKQQLSDTLKISKDHQSLVSTDKVWKKLMAESPQAYGMYISVPAKASETIYASVYAEPGQYYKSESHEFDQHTLKEFKGSGPYNIKYAEAGFGDKLRKMNYDIHVGAILGLPGKILAFCAALICASLPITGVCIWWGRRKKTKKKVI